MRRLIVFLIFVIALGVAVYFGLNRLILPNVELFTYVDYIIIGGIVLATLLVGIFFVIFLYNGKDKKISWLKSRLQQWNFLSVRINKAGDEVFSKLPIGIFVYDDDFVIKWANIYVKELFRNDLLEASVLEVCEPLHKALVSSENHVATIEWNGVYLDVIHRVENRTVYLFDVTKREQITIKYAERTPALGLIALDNLEMETKTFDMQETARIRGQFLGEISDWVAKFNGYLKDYDDDSLVVILDQQNLQKMILDKFTVLDKVREISAKNGIRVTLSIGIACHDVSYAELGSYAQNAIDLAEKRGGDQVVVNIQGEKIQYFGAKTNALEKNNLLAARANTLALKDAIESSSNVFITGHTMADADALGSMIGALRMVLTSKKPVKIILDYDHIDATSQKIYEEIKQKDQELFSYFIGANIAMSDVNNESLLLIMDTQSPRIIMNEELLNKFKRIAVVDHHRSDSEGFNDPVFSYIEPYASSTVELITEMFQFYQRESIPISPFEATIMLAGLVVDTNNFTFRCGTRTFEAASTLREFGADMIDIRKLLRNDFGFQVALAKYVQTSDIVLDQFIVCQLSEDEVIEDRTLLAKVAEYLLNINNVEATFVIAAYRDEYGNIATAISARSFKDINVQLIMEEMGGGGHLNGAAAQIKEKTPSEVKAELLTILKRDFEKGGGVMKVILLEDVKGRGNKNQVIDVAAGYGNFLVSNKKAVIATEEAMNKLKEDLKQAEIEALEQKKLMQKIKEDIEEKSVNIYIKIGSDGKLYGHVTTKQICDEFEAQTGIHLDKRKVSLPVEIDSLGVYSAVVDLHKEVKANLEINVLEK